jgi:tetratricopeptide (TPR) repeat protein
VKRVRRGVAFLALALALGGCGDPEARRAAREASALLDAGQHEDALAAYREAADRFPEEAMFPFGEGTALYRMERYADSEAPLRRAVELDPGDSAMRLQLGHALARLEQADEAVVQYREAARLDPLNAPAWRSLGLAEMNRGNYPEAREALEKYLAFAREAEDTMAISHLLRSLPRTGDGNAEEVD